jgi:hypothetical protein
MRHLPFDKPGVFWRGNVHCHSVNSDGALTVAEICQQYHSAGYHFLAITDHFVAEYAYPVTDGSAFHRPDFITLSAAELTVNRLAPGEPTNLARNTAGLVDVIAIGISPHFKAQVANESAPALLKRAQETGAFLAVVHPQVSKLTHDDILWLKHIHAIEIFNAAADDWSDVSDAWHLGDVLLNRGENFLFIASDDAHVTGDADDRFRGWIEVRASHLTAETILQALKEGNFYSSTGASIHDVVFTASGKILVRCSPASRIVLSGCNHTYVSVKGENLTEVELSLNDFQSPYGRITVRSMDGKRAWTNPFWFEDQPAP